MITTNSSGTALSAGYADAVKADTRTFLAQLLISGTALDCSIKKLEVSKGSCGSSTEFSVGNIISSTLVAEVKELTDAVKSEEVEVRIGLDVNGTYEWVTLGFFTISEVKKTLYATKLTGHGRIVSNGGTDFSVPTTPTLAQIAYRIGVGLGCTVTLDASIDDSLAITEPLNGLTNYQALQILTSVVGGFAVDTHDGNVKVCLFDDTATHSVNAGMMTSLPDVEEKDFAITGVRCVVSEASSDDDGEIPAVGYEQGVVNLAMNNKYMTQALFNDMASIIGYTYRPATINLSLGDPRIEGDDVLSVTDADNSVYTVPCHILKHTYSGGFHTTIESVRATNSEDDIGSLSPMQMMLSEISSGVVSAKSEAGKAKTIANNTAQYFWFTGTGTDTGAHITEVPQEDWDDPTSQGYHSGGNLLARSNGIAVRDGLTELATFGATGATIGALTEQHLDISSGGFVFNSGNSELARLQSYSNGVSLGSGDIAYRTDDSSVIDFGSNSVAVFAKDGNESYSTSFHVAPNEVNAYVGQYEYGQLMLVDNALIFRTTNSMANNALFIGGENFTKFTVDWNGNAVGNSFSGKIDAVVYEDFDFSVTYSAGTVGTRGAEYTASGAKSGYKPISATVIAGNTYYNFFVARVADGGTVTLSAYRATTSARSDDAVKVRVAYLKV